MSRKIGEAADRWLYFCPACECAHGPTKAVWTFNGDQVRPTFQPSIDVKRKDEKGNVIYRCHSFVTDGQISYIGDCTHALAGQTVALPDL